MNWPTAENLDPMTFWDESNPGLHILLISVPDGQIPNAIMVSVRSDAQEMSIQFIKKKKKC